MDGISLLELEKLVDFFYSMDYIDDLGEADNQQEKPAIQYLSFTHVCLHMGTDTTFLH